MIDIGYFIQGQEELRTLKAAISETAGRVERLNNLLDRKYFEIATRWQTEQRAFNRHLANPMSK